MDVDGGGVAGISRLLSLPRWPEDSTPQERVELVAEEAYLRDQLITYGNAIDTMNLDAVLVHFADNCVLINPRARRVGLEDIRAEYEGVFGRWSMLRHMWNNVVIRFPRVDEAYRSAYVHTMLVSDEKKLASVATDVHRLSKINGAWKIVERWTTHDVTQDITLNPSGLADR